MTPFTQKDKKALETPCWLANREFTIPERWHSAMHFYACRCADEGKGDEKMIAQKYGAVFASVFLRETGSFPDLPPSLDANGIDLLYREFDRNLQDVAVLVCDKATRDAVKRTKGDEYAWSVEWAEGKPAGRYATMKPNDLLSLVYLEDMGVPTITMVALVRWDHAQKLLIDPANPKFVGQRKMLYYASLNLKVR